MGRVQREVIAFECSYEYDPLTTQPTITWQTCNSDGSFTDVVPATNIFASPDPREGLEEYVFFQTNFTAYLQLINSTNLDYNGTQYRCKAVSNIPGDTTEVFSNCATITQFDDSEFLHAFMHTHIDEIRSLARCKGCSTLACRHGVVS